MVCHVVIMIDLSMKVSRVSLGDIAEKLKKTNKVDAELFNMVKPRYDLLTLSGLNSVAGYINNRFTYLVEHKTVKQNCSHTVITPLKISFIFSTSHFCPISPIFLQLLLLTWTFCVNDLVFLNLQLSAEDVSTASASCPACACAYSVFKNGPTLASFLFILVLFTMQRQVGIARI